MREKKVVDELREAFDAVQAAGDPSARVAAGRRLRQAAEELELALVEEARAGGVRWVDIGELYGTSKQSVQQRFRRRSTRAV